MHYQRMERAIAKVVDQGLPQAPAHDEVVNYGICYILAALEDIDTDLEQTDDPKARAALMGYRAPLLRQLYQYSKDA